MLILFLHLSQWCYRHHLRFFERLFEKLNLLLYSADIPARTKIHPSVSFAHSGIGVIINELSKIGEGCVINAKVTLGNAYPRNGYAPKLGKGVYVGVGAFLGGGIRIADYVVIGANAVLTKDILEPGVIVAGVPAKIIRKLTPEELEKRINGK